MLDLPFGVTADDFRWCVGIEDTFVPQVRGGLRPLDEYQLMGHYQHWREDLVLARETGARMVRWGIPWYRVEPAPGQFDWSWVDQVLPYMVQDLGLEPILDLVHYGTPDWLARSFVDPGYPEAVAAYARAVAGRYGGLITHYTPLDEPIVNALMCGRRGVWPPYLRGDRGFLAVGLALAKGIVRTVRALKDADPHAIMVHVEAAGLFRAAREELEPLAAERQRRGFLFFDLITGRVTPTHPLYSWLLDHGVSVNDLRFLAENKIDIDLMGLNFYPWSTKEVTTNQRGQSQIRLADRQGASFGQLITSYYERYMVPVMITETSAKGGIALKRRWLEDSVATVRLLRRQGVPVLGYTWFPLFTMVDWAYRNGRGSLQEYLIELGLYESTMGHDGSLRHSSTALVDRFRALTEDPEAAVGDLMSEELVSGPPESR